MERHDVVVVGAGSGGLAAAHAAKFRGASVCIVQDGPIGGDCTWTGCVPSKTLLSAAEKGRSFDESMATVHSAIADIAATETAEVLTSHGFTVVEGRGRLVGGGIVEVGGQAVEGRQVIVAPGSRPALPPITGLADVPYLTNEDLWSLDRLPNRMIIIGGGPIGCEMAQAFAAMGSAVTMVEGENRLLPRDDPAASAVVEAALVARGVSVRTGHFVDHARHDRQQTEVTIGGETLGFDAVLVATGRAPAHNDMGLEDVGVDLGDDGWITVDRHMQTTASGVWAVGDAVGSRQFTHAAAHMARIAVDNSLRVGMAKVRKLRFDPDEIPWVTFTTPEVAQVGVTEADASAIKGARVAELPMAAVDRAVTAGQTEGFIKLIAVPRPVVGFAGGGRLVGATVVGGGAGEMIGELALAVRTKMFAGRLAQTVHAYPTLSFGIQMAAAQFLGTIDGRTSRAPRSERDASL